MIDRSRTRRGAGLLIAAVLCAALPVHAAGTSRITGKITEGSKKQPVPGAVVIAYHLSLGHAARSEPTGPNGKYEILDLANGYYDLAVEHAGLYVGNQVVNAPPDGLAVANMNLLPSSQVTEQPRGFAGSEQPITGVASFVPPTPSHVAWWAGGGGVALLLLLGASDSSSGGGVPSPSAPLP
jgi:hypothetical protein